jgi:hypothetical protein
MIDIRKLLMKNAKATKAMTPAPVNNVLSLVLDTGVDSSKLLAVGFTEEFINSYDERVIQFHKATLDPSTIAGKNEIPLTITGRFIGMGQLKNATGELAVTVVYATNRTYYLVKKQRAVFTFVVDATSLGMKDAMREMLRSNLLKGPRIFGMSANIVEGFWVKAFQAVCDRAEIMEIELKSKDGLPVPSRLYFDPKRPDNSTLSVGGWCYPFNLVDFPKKAIADGTKLWIKDQAKKVEPQEAPRGNRIVPKPTNKRIAEAA